MNNIYYNEQSNLFIYLFSTEFWYKIHQETCKEMQMTQQEAADILLLHTMCIINYQR